jgi:very-short-patch-repair endonuclease
VAKQFDLNVKAHFFPSKFNCPKNYFYIGKMPPSEMFFDLIDTTEAKQLKTDYIAQKHGENWQFMEELQLFSAYKVKVLARICLKFLKSSINFQLTLKKVVNHSSTLILYPFSKLVISAAAFHYKVYCCYCLNNEEIYAVLNENTNSCKTVSRSEYELGEYLAWSHPDRHYQTAFSSPEGQKLFGSYPVDIYCSSTKEVIQLAGCSVHLHEKEQCLDPNRKNFDRSIYGKSKSELLESDFKLQNLLRNKFRHEVTKYKIVYKCHWKKFKKSNAKYRKFLDTRPPKLNLCTV